MTEHLGTGAQPVTMVDWVPREHLVANGYNPNRVAPPELRLLKLSILEDGWTQPIVTLPPVWGPEPGECQREIVDGFHRWTISADPEIWRLTDGLVPCVTIHPDPASQRMSTVRHNRARGSHHVVKMADIVADLAAGGIPHDEISRRLGMEAEEVRRLLDRGNMLERGRGDGFGEAWKPAPK